VPDQAAEPAPPAGRVARRGPRRGAAGAADPPLLDQTVVEPPEEREDDEREAEEPDCEERDCVDREVELPEAGAVREREPEPDPVDERPRPPPEPRPEPRPVRSSGMGWALGTTTRGALGPAMLLIAASPARTLCCVGVMAARRIRSATSRR
jgi:hypothetical protein